jgi:hypothetical protein
MTLLGGQMNNYLNCARDLVRLAGLLDRMGFEEEADLLDEAVEIIAKKNKSLDGLKGNEDSKNNVINEQAT